MTTVLDDDGQLAMAAHADLAALVQDLLRDHVAPDASPLAADPALEQVWFLHMMARHSNVRRPPDSPLTTSLLR